MAYPIITYNQSTGSNTNPSDAIASSVSTSTTVSCADNSTTITFSSAVDFTANGGVANDGSDYIWIDNTSGNDRKLHQIVSFNPSTSACTSVTTYETTDTGGVTLSSLAWHVNGTRRDITSSSTVDLYDSYDWMPGWTILLDGNQTRDEGWWRLGVNFGSSGHTVTVNDPAVVIRPKSDTGRVEIRNTGQHELFRLNAFMIVRMERLDVITESAGANNRFHVAAGNVDAFDCRFVSPASSAPEFIDHGSGDSSCFVKCYFCGGTDIVINSNSNHTTLINCWVDCQGTHGTVSAINLNGVDTNVCENVLITDGPGDGIVINRQGNAGRHCNWVIRNCTIINCAGDGIKASGTPTANTSPSWNIVVFNCLIASNGGYGFNRNSQPIESSGYIGFNGFYNNASGEYSEKYVSTMGNDVTCVTTPFVNTGAEDYSINTTSNGGALIRQAGLNAIPLRP